MKKNMLIITLLSSTLLTAQYTGKGFSSAESKKEACSKALQNAKVDAMEQAGTLVYSNFYDTTSDTNGKIFKENKSRITTASLGVAKLQSKDESVKVTDNYQFLCKVKANFTINQKQMKKKLEEILDTEKLHGYFQAEAHSEEGQSKYKAFSSATLLAQRNLLEIIKGADITSLTKMNHGQVQTDKIGKLISGTLQGAEVIKKEYNQKTQSAHVVLRISKKIISQTLSQ